MESLKYALKYAKLNFKVFPLKVNSKSEQVCKSWKNEATTDEKLIRTMWKNNYNVGVVTGNGLVVIDVDVKNGKDGRLVFNEYAKNFPETFTVKTPNGGYHYWYLVDRAIPCKVNLYEGIDIRGNGGYILSPGSIVDNIEYVAIKDIPIAQANDAVYEFLNSKPVVTNRKENLNTIEQGCRNDTLFKEACGLQSRGFSDEAILACILKENEVRCESPLPDNEVIRIVDSVITRYPKGKMNSFSSKKQDSVNANDLVNMKLSYKPNVVDNMFVIGMNLFGAAQKNGKTFFCLQLANCVASGTPFLGNKVDQGFVYYIALEDVKHNIQKRLINFEIEISSNLEINFGQAYDKNFDIERIIIDQKEKHPDLKLIIIDTYAKIQETKNTKNSDKYKEEYKEGTHYHEIAVKYNIAILLVTHIKKLIDRNCPFDSFYGTRGLAAAADATLVMLRPSFSSMVKELYITGKEIPDDCIQILQNERMLYELSDEDVEENQADKDLIAILHYVVRKKTYTGTMSQLCSSVGVEIRPNKMSAMLKKFTSILDEYFVKFEQLPKTAKERPIRLTYYGEEDE